MDWQTIINVTAGAVLSVVGWIARMLWEAVSELKRDLASLREKLPETYVAKDDYKEDIREIKSLMERIYDKLDGKADK